MENISTAPAHTPGPWKVVGTEIWSEKHDGVCGMVLGNVGGSYSVKDRAVRQANARLIAAAPDLLAACEHALAFMESIPHSAGLTNIDPQPLIAALCKVS